MTREEEERFLSFVEDSASQDESMSKHLASDASMKRMFVQMYRAKSQECDEKDKRIEELEKKELSPKEALPQLQPSTSIYIQHAENLSMTDINEMVMQKQVGNEIQNVSPGGTGVVVEKQNRT